MGKLKVQVFGRGMAWMDAGTHESLLESANFIETIQKRQGMYIACIEEIAYRLGYITREQLKELAKSLISTDYGRYLLFIAEDSPQWNSSGDINVGKFERLKTKLDEVTLIRPTAFRDGRGFFLETYNRQEFAEIGIYDEFVQDNVSQSVKGVVRGLHYQTKNAPGVEETGKSVTGKNF